MHRLLKNRFLYLGIVIALCFSQCKPDDMKYYMLVGTYTHTDSKGIYVFEFDPSNGETNLISTQGEIKNPSYLTIHGENVYAVSETNGEEVGHTYAYRLDRSTGQLHFLNDLPSQGDDPCYIETDEGGRFAAVANYSSGSLIVYPLEKDGRLGSDVQFIKHENPSRVNPKRQEAPHVHETVFSPDQHFLLTPDLGKDQVTIYRFNPEDKEPLDSFGVIENSPGSGPRHIAFHPSGKFAYLIHELNATVTAYEYNDGHFDRIQNVNTWKASFDGRKDGSEIKLSPDGNFLYASSRGDQNSIAVYSVDQKIGKLTMVQIVPSGGRGPRDIEIDPTGKYLLAANQGTNNIVVFERDRETGRLTQKKELSVPLPVCIKFTEK